MSEEEHPDRHGVEGKPEAKRADRRDHVDTPENSSMPEDPPPPPSPTFLRPRGDYRTLLSYQKAVVVYQITHMFCARFLSRGDRTVDQMVQAARSGKQNIVEGSKAAVASKDMEIKLTNVARASLEELLEDYLDFLRVHGLTVWEKDSREAAYARKLGMTNPLSFEVFREFAETRPAEVVANLAVCLIHQTNFLLDRQLRSLGEAFLNDGGLRERMTQARRQSRRQRKTDGHTPA